jgi:hypothetical protein
LVGVTEPAYRRWRKQCGGLEVDRINRFKAPGQENARLKRVTAGGG